ncbi:MAG: ABC transporter ATP-binding protein [Mariniblastus sp.]
MSDINIQQLRFRYPGSDFELDLEFLDIQAGERVAVVGPSGCGKTTLLNLISGIIVPNHGLVKVDDEAVSRMSDAKRRDFRIAKIGMVFQQFELVEYLNAIDNILLPFAINDSLKYSDEILHKAKGLAASMGLEGKLSRRPSKLSQGEQQRVAICRALITDPQLILADEPTGNLDPRNKRLILDSIFAQADLNSQTIVVVTHDMSILDGFDRTIDFEDFFVDVSQREGAL